MAISQARSHTDRIRFGLNEIRKELVGEVARLKPEDLVWAPAEGMKSYRDLLLEIGTMERICREFLTAGEPGNWKQTWDALAAKGDEIKPLLGALEEVRSATLAYLDSCDEERLQTPMSLPEEWQGYFGGPTVEPEEFLRWIALHEYYHLGQFITYRWIQGDNPYKRGDA